MKAIILLGGRGTRLLPLTINTPKPLISLFDCPLIIYQIGLLKKYGISEVILSLGYLSKKIKDFLKSRKEQGISIKYVIEKEPLGTAGAIKNAENLLKEEAFLVMNGDIITDINLKHFISFYHGKNARAVIALTAVDDPTSYGLVKTDKKRKVRQFLEKPSWAEAGGCKTINAGVYMFAPDILSCIPPGRNFSIERELFPRLLQMGEKFFGYVTRDYWLDMGTLEKYRQAHRDILEKKVSFPPLSFRKTESNVWFDGNSRISPHAKLTGPVMIGENCKIADDAEISSFSVIGRNCIIEDSARVVNSIILEGTRIGRETNMEGCIIGKHCRIENNVVISEGVALGDKSMVKAFSQI
jgi:mannose-1-phosphate guanylyltransferase / phosphomannomutase